MTTTRLVLVAAAALLALAGCSTSDADDGVASAGGTSSAPAAQASDEEQALEFVECMRDNGIDLPDPEPNGNGGFSYGLAQLGVDLSDDTLRKAIQACRDKLPDGGSQFQHDPATQEQMREFAQCMRDHGIDLPDPDPDGGFGGALGEIDRNSPAFQQAVEACQDKLPARGGR